MDNLDLMICGLQARQLYKRRRAGVKLGSRSRSSIVASPSTTRAAPQTFTRRWFA